MPYSPVYSSPFIQYTDSTPNASFEVPDGFTAVIRQWSCYQDIGDYVFFVTIYDSVDAPGITVVAAEQEGLVNYVAGEGRWVVPGGGYIDIGFSTLGTAVQAYVGGYLLTNVLD